MKRTMACWGSRLTLATVMAWTPSLASRAWARTCEVPLYKGLGTYQMTVTTTNELAQKYFDQGFMLTYGFNHAAARRAFKKALELDPKCAMCQWGVAYTLGPNINMPMLPSAVPEAYQASRQALALSARATPREQALIKALTKRYARAATGVRAELDKSYAVAMADVARKYPDDVDVLSLYAEALLDTSPWHYWTAAGEPLPVTPKIMSTLETAMKLNPEHPGANHFYIHVVEAAKPQLGVAAADRLRGKVPDAGHLVHMPGHIYIRVGRYADAAKVNEDAIASDQRYLAGCPANEPMDIYRMMYVPHNYEFLIAALSLDGRKAESQEAARKVAAYSAPLLASMPEDYDLQGFWATTLTSYVRFGDWSKILQAAEPDEHWLYARALWHYARAMAFVRTADLTAAATEIDAMAKLAARSELKGKKLMGLNDVTDVLAIGLAEAKGELAAARGDVTGAITELENAIARQDALTYIEPPAWYHSVRLALAAVLLDAERNDEAETVLRKDLEEFPENGWALFGLAESLERQGRAKEAAQIRQRFDTAWQRADVTLSAPRF